MCQLITYSSCVIPSWNPILEEANYSCNIISAVAWICKTAVFHLDLSLNELLTFYLNLKFLVLMTVCKCWLFSPCITKVKGKEWTPAVWYCFCTDKAKKIWSRIYKYLHKWVFIMRNKPWKKAWLSSDREWQQHTMSNRNLHFFPFTTENLFF